MRALAAFILLAAPACAQDHITVPGKLSDADFYRLVACAAPPGGDCQKPIVRWQAERPLLVWLAPIPRAYLGGKKRRAEAAFARALQELNGAEAGLTLLRTERRDIADIHVFFHDQPRGGTINGTGFSWADGAQLGGATTLVAADAAKGTILKATVNFSTTLSIESYEGVMLEELTQALGLMTDVDSPAYEGVSVLAQHGNSVRKLGPQDIMALRRHYSQN